MYDIFTLRWLPEHWTEIGCSLSAGFYVFIYTSSSYNNTVYKRTTVTLYYFGLVCRIVLQLFSPGECTTVSSRFHTFMILIFLMCYSEHVLVDVMQRTVLLSELSLSIRLSNACIVTTRNIRLSVYQTWRKTNRSWWNGHIPPEILAEIDPPIRNVDFRYVATSTSLGTLRPMTAPPHDVRCKNSVQPCSTT